MAKLLIVDDERNIRRSLERFFQALGHTVVAAEGGPQAAEMVAGQTFDVILTDYKMAELNGLELLQQIKYQAPETPVILMRAQPTSDAAMSSQAPSTQR